MFEVRCAEGASKAKKEAFEKVMKTHHDQGNFKRTGSSVDLIKINGAGRERVTGDVSAIELEQLISQNVMGGFEKRLLKGHDEPGKAGNEELDKGNEELQQENNRLRSRLSELESQISEVTDSVSQNAEDIEELDEKTDRIIEEFTEVNERVLSRLDDIEEKVESSDEEERIRNRRKG